jgi:hypothetical protein
VVPSGLRVLMAGKYSEAPLTLFRGVGVHERRRRVYGFSWSKDALAAHRFAVRAADAKKGCDFVMASFLSLVA